MKNLKEIHIGKYIKERYKEKDIEMERVCKFLKLNEKKIENMFEQNSIDTEILLKWSKLLEYDFFRLYSQHLILFSPQGNINYNENNKSPNTKLPRFRKNVYTKEIIDFILELIENKEKTRKQIIEEYNIPKTTLYKWIEKYAPKK